MKLLIVLALALALSPAAAIFDTAPTSEELRSKYPALENDGRAGNALILCPFLRMLERSGRLDASKQNGQDTISNQDLKEAAEEFGCDTITGCGPVIDTVSAGQWATSEFSFSKFNPFNTPTVDLERLWNAPPISHQCGFTFEKNLGQNGVSSARLESTMSKLLARADAQGHLVYQDILDTKNEICASEGETIDAPGLIETQLIYAYLGGMERGYVEYSDVEGFLAVDTKMPLNKAAQQITAFYLLQVK